MRGFHQRVAHPDVRFEPKPLVGVSMIKASGEAWGGLNTDI